MESELFGHVKGSFTGATGDRVGHFAAADGGTLFLDEIGELPLAAQVKLLRALQEGEIRRVGDAKTMQVDVRIIAATNRELATEVGLGHFRVDLFYRLAVLILKYPLSGSATAISLPSSRAFSTASTNRAKARRSRDLRRRKFLMMQDNFLCGRPGPATFESLKTLCGAPLFGAMER